MNTEALKEDIAQLKKSIELLTKQKAGVEASLKDKGERLARWEQMLASLEPTAQAKPFEEGGTVNPVVNWQALLNSPKK